MPHLLNVTKDLVWNSTGTGTVGRINIITDVDDKTFVADSHVTVIRPQKVDCRFIWCYIAAPGIQKRIEPDDEKSLVSGTTKQVELNTSAVITLEVPIPPLAEQHRIVAKVDELMSLCDQLEQQTEDSIAAHQTLVETLLDTLTQSQNAEELAQNWNRISDHFDTLFNTEHSIDQLKQTILQLAVMGKLVPQDPNDEPASILLEKIGAEKDRLIKEKKIKKQKPLPEISEDEKPFDLPEGWKWIILKTAINLLNGYAFKSSWFSDKGVRLLRNINILHGQTRWVELACIDNEVAKNFKKYRLCKGDVVLSLDRPIINTGLKFAVISEDDLPCLLLQRVAKLHSYCELIKPLYLTKWLESDYFISRIDPGRSNGVPHISTTQVGNMLFPLPPLGEQRRIIEKANQLIKLCDQLKTNLTKAQNYRIHLTNSIRERVII